MCPHCRAFAPSLSDKEAMMKFGLTFIVLFIIIMVFSVVVGLAMTHGIMEGLK